MAVALCPLKALFTKKTMRGKQIFFHSKKEGRTKEALSAIRTMQNRRIRITAFATVCVRLWGKRGNGDTETMGTDPWGNTQTTAPGTIFGKKVFLSLKRLTQVDLPGSLAVIQ